MLSVLLAQTCISIRLQKSNPVPLIFVQFRHVCVWALYCVTSPGLRLFLSIYPAPSSYLNKPPCLLLSASFIHAADLPVVLNHVSCPAAINLHQQTCVYKETQRVRQKKLESKKILTSLGGVGQKKKGWWTERTGWQNILELWVTITKYEIIRPKVTGNPRSPGYLHFGRTESRLFFKNVICSSDSL